MHNLLILLGSVIVIATSSMQIQNANKLPVSVEADRIKNTAILTLLLSLGLTVRQLYVMFAETKMGGRFENYTKSIFE